MLPRESLKKIAVSKAAITILNEAHFDATGLIAGEWSFALVSPHMTIEVILSREALWKQSDHNHWCLAPN